MLRLQLMPRHSTPPLLACALFVHLIVGSSCQSRSIDKILPPVAHTAVSPKQGSVVPEIHDLRQVLPQSGYFMLSGRIGFRWRGVSSHVELSRSRTFDEPLQKIVGSILSSDPDSLSAISPELSDGIWFWRVSDNRRVSESVWSFRVRHVGDVHDAIGVRNGADVNCDGHPDILRRGQVVLNGDPATILRCELGDVATGDLKPESADEIPDWGQLVNLGDLDGDGCEDAMLTVTPLQHQRLVSRAPVPILFHGRAGLVSTWRAARRLTHQLGPIGDINVDGYGDTAECTDAGCSVYLGGPDFPNDHPLFRLDDYRFLLEGDFNADGLPDLWASDGTFSAAGRLAFLSGSSVFPHTPLAPLIIPGASIGLPTTGLLVAGKLAALGLGTSANSDLLWQATLGPDKVTIQHWPTVYVPRLRSKAWRVTAWEFIPFTGPGARGVMLVLPGKPEAGWDPSHSFLQYGLSAAGRLTYMGQVATPTLEPTDSIVGFSRTGDLNGDGYDDVVVQAMDDTLGGELSFEYMGSSAGFSYRQRL